MWRYILLDVKKDTLEYNANVKLSRDLTTDNAALQICREWLALENLPNDTLIYWIQMSIFNYFTCSFRQTMVDAFQFGVNRLYSTQRQIYWEKAKTYGVPLDAILIL